MMMAERPAGDVLPLRKLQLFETGVGYFERKGAARPGKRMALPLPAAHLDDALKSLVILDASGSARIHGIEFESAMSEGMARAMAGLPSEAGAPLHYADLLESLSGAKVEVRFAGKRVRGRLVDVEGPFVQPVKKGENDNEDQTATPKANPEQPPSYYTLLVLGDDDGLRRISTLQVEAIRPLDTGAADRLDAAGQALSDQAARHQQSLQVQVGGTGQLALGYIAETPVWRTTYRVVLDEDAPRGQLQGWALVHNDTDESWNDVSIELVNGQPASFLHPLAAPRYARRELITPDDELSTVPQLAGTTVDRMWADGEPAYGVGGIGMSGYGRGEGGSAAGSVGHGMVGSAVGVGSTVSLGDLAELAKASSEEAGALFVYRVSDPVDLEAHHSALLPIVQQSIEAESITWFEPGDHEGLSAVRLVNSTGQTLPPGTVSFFGHGGFAGESVLDRVGPGERRFVGYGRELDVELTRSRQVLQQRPVNVRLAGEQLQESYVEKVALTLTLDNRSRRAQRTYVGLDLPRNAKLEGDGKVELDFDLSSQTPLAATVVEPGETVTHRLRAEVPGHRTHALELEALRSLLDRGGLDETIAGPIRTARDHLERATKLDAAARADGATLDIIEADLERLRKNLVALGKAGASKIAKDKLSRALLHKEARVEELRQSIERGQAKARRAREQMLAALSVLD